MNLQSYIIYLNDLGFQHPSDEVMKVYKEVPGFSAPYVMSLLNIAVRHMQGNEMYLEVGTYRGRSLIGAMIGTGDRAGVGIDNFSEFCDNPTAQETEIRERIKAFKLDGLVDFICANYKSYIPERPVGVYFYDGCHNTEPGLQALKYMVPYLAEQALIVVDDFSGEGVWRSVHRFTNLYKQEARVLFSMHTNDFPTPHRNWWNGVVILGWNKQGKFR